MFVLSLATEVAGSAGVSPTHTCFAAFFSSCTSKHVGNSMHSPSSSSIFSEACRVCCRQQLRQKFWVDGGADRQQVLISNCAPAAAFAALFASHTPHQPTAFHQVPAYRRCHHHGQTPEAAPRSSRWQRCRRRECCGRFCGGLAGLRLRQEM